jgi:hypothetical protein
VANKALFPGRQPVSPLMHVVVADRDLSLSVFQVTLKTASPFEVTTTVGTCPGQLCPLGSYYQIGEPGGAPPNPMTKELLAWFMAADGAAARRFIEGQTLHSPDVARGPIDTLDLTAAGPRWHAREAGSPCPAR